MNITRISLQSRHAILARTPQELQTTLDDIGVKSRLVEDNIKQFRAHVSGDDDRKLFDALDEKTHAFWSSAEANLALTRSGKKDEAFAQLVDVLIPARNALLSQSAALRDYQQGQLAMLEGRTTEALAATKRVLLAAGAAVLLTLGGVAWLLAIGLRQRVSLASAVAERIATGDLASEVPVHGRDEFVPLLQRLAQMQRALQALVGKVRASSNSIATASAEIASGNADLSVRTEQTAGNLQQTASAMQQLTGTVRQSSESASQATQLACSAADVALRGGSVVARVVTTMGEIEASSQRMADIVGVIDGIAFQTNILALNAAVEAARAGEQGRGFAVVAAEVRSLAQRSAAAAKEIHALITSSVDKVKSGAELVGEAGQTMTDIVGSVQRVADMIGAISAAATEQSHGIGQVNGSVSNLDQMTQQNAALVEQSAAASESLKVQVQSLTQALGIFRLAAG